MPDDADVKVVVRLKCSVINSSWDGGHYLDERGLAAKNTEVTS